jgi:hypothetical protein
MKLLLLLPAVALLLSMTIRPAGLPAPVLDHLVFPPSAPKMWIENDRAFLGDTIELRFQKTHPEFLGVINPDGKFFYLVFPASESIGKLTPLVDSKVFLRLDRLEISTAHLKADPYEYGVVENQTVFTKSGAYDFILGDNLHVDDPTAVYRVTVRYKHSGRPGQQSVVSN